MCNLMFQLEVKWRNVVAAACCLGYRYRSQLTSVYVRVCLCKCRCVYQCQHLYQSVHLSAFKSFNNELALTTEKRVRVHPVSD